MAKRWRWRWRRLWRPRKRGAGGGALASSLQISQPHRVTGYRAADHDSNRPQCTEQPASTNPSLFEDPQVTEVAMAEATDGSVPAGAQRGAAGQARTTAGLRQGGRGRGADKVGGCTRCESGWAASRTCTSSVNSKSGAEDYVDARAAAMAAYFGHLRHG